VVDTKTGEMRYFLNTSTHIIEMRVPEAEPFSWQVEIAPTIAEACSLQDRQHLTEEQEAALLAGKVTEFRVMTGLPAEVPPPVAPQEREAQHSGRGALYGFGRLNGIALLILTAIEVVAFVHYRMSTYDLRPRSCCDFFGPDLFGHEFADAILAETLALLVWAGTLVTLVCMVAELIRARRAANPSRGPHRFRAADYYRIAGFDAVAVAVAIVANILLAMTQ
jgi:hypothetical protein